MMKAYMFARGVEILCFILKRNITAGVGGQAIGLRFMTTQLKSEKTGVFLWCVLKFYAVIANLIWDTYSMMAPNQQA